MGADVHTVRTPGLGNSSYLLVAGKDGLVVDPPRDAWRLLRLAEELGVRIRFVLETHVHNDYLSGARELRSATRAEIAAPAGSRLEFVHRALRDGDEVELDGVVVRALATPGHTPEHTAFLVLEDGEERAVFTGGSLMVGGAGRTDLLGPAMAEPLTRAQFASLRRLATLPPLTGVYPTHGAGSFCAATPASDAATSTIGEERATNPAMAFVREREFVRARLRDLPVVPAYYAAMAPANRSGPPVAGSVRRPQRLSSSRVEDLARSGAWVIDSRDRRSFAAAHVPGAVNVELQDAFATYVGSIVPVGAHIVLVVDEPEDDNALAAATQLFRIGYDVGGTLAGGIDGWVSSGRPAATYPVARRGDRLPAGEIVVDVRQPLEWRREPLRGARRMTLGDLPARGADLPAGRVWTTCRSGLRAAAAASLLARSGRLVGLVADGGMPARESARAARRLAARSVRLHG